MNNAKVVTQILTDGSKAYDVEVRWEAEYNRKIMFSCYSAGHAHNLATAINDSICAVELTIA